LLNGPQNDATRNESNKDMLRLKKQVDYWKEQAGLAPHLRDVVDLVDIQVCGGVCVCCVCVGWWGVRRERGVGSV
jgi:hypothetical protein